ncbi:MAG: hypothetical protein JWO46_1271 [Nocardioidaceae bacterium]|nr:hypothetical protein [Nocardioidaceae bacterium]
MSTPSPYGPQPTRPLPIAPGQVPGLVPGQPGYVVPVRPRVPTGRAVRATVLWSLGSGLLVGLAVALVAFVTGSLINGLNSVDDNDLSAWWVLFAFVVGTAMATLVGSLINVPVLLLMRMNDGFASMAAVLQGLISWLVGWIPFGLLFFVLAAVGGRHS